MLYKLHIGNVYHSKWLLCIKYILNSCGYLELWNNQVVKSNFNLAKKVKNVVWMILLIIGKHLFSTRQNVFIIERKKLNLVSKCILLLFHMI